MSNDIESAGLSSTASPGKIDGSVVAPAALVNSLAPRLVLRILGGSHTGASRVLGEQEMLLIGSGEDCDIVLSDIGVASHHAMLLRNGDSLAVRAIDAPAGFAGDPLYPGDPIELPLGAPVRLGDASFAVGNASDPAWMPDGDAEADALAPLNSRRVRRPGLAAVAAGLIAIAAVSAAAYVRLQPASAPAPRIEQQIATLVSTYGISDNTTSINDAGITVLTGTVPNGAARDRAQQDVEANALPLLLNLRTGDDVAADVAEVLRSQGITARTRYLGNGDVEISGRFEDQDKLRAAATSRAMIDVTGINRVIPLNFVDEEATALESAKPHVERTRIVSVVGGAESYLLASDGTRYPVGAELPDDRGTLIAIRKAAWALVDGEIRQVKPDPPVTADPLPESGDVAGDRLKTTAKAGRAASPATAKTPPSSSADNPSAAVARQYTAGTPRLRSNRM